MQSWALVTLLLSLAAANPGIQVSLSEATLNTGLMIAYAFGLTSAHFNLGNYSFVYATDLGDFHVNLTNVNITSISLDYSTSVFSFQSPDYIIYTINNLTVEATTGYELTYMGMHYGPDQATISLTETNLTANISLSAVNSHPQIHIAGLELTLGDILVETPLPTEINKLINDEIADKESYLDTELPSLVETYIPVLDQLLLNLNLVLACPVEPLAVDLGITQGPSIVRDSLLVIGLNGTILADGAAVPATPPVSVPDHGVLPEGFQVAVTDSVVNALLVPVWSTLSYVVTSLPASFGISLNTASLAIFFPQLRNTYGNNKPVNLRVYTLPGQGAEYWTDGEINLLANATIDFLVNSQSNWYKALTLNFTIDLDLAASVSNNVANFEIKSVVLSNVKTLNSTVGAVNLPLFTSLFNDLATITIPLVNPKLLNIGT